MLQDRVLSFLASKLQCFNSMMALTRWKRFCSLCQWYTCSVIPHLHDKAYLEHTSCFMFALSCKCGITLQLCQSYVSDTHWHCFADMLQVCALYKLWFCNSRTWQGFCVDSRFLSVCSVRPAHGQRSLSVSIFHLRYYSNGKKGINLGLFTSVCSSEHYKLSLRKFSICQRFL